MKLFVAAILAMGLSGLIAQIVLLREMLVIFSGNEISIGIILANWLALEALGAFFLGKAIEKTKRKIEAFVAVQIAFSLFLPAAIYWVRILKVIMGVIPGEGLGLWPILYSSFLILAPVSLLHGALFTFGCKIFSDLSKDSGRNSASPRTSGASSVPSLPSRLWRFWVLGLCPKGWLGAGSGQAASVGHVYVYETLGTMIGGLVLTYLLVPHLHSFKIALGVSGLNLLFCVLLLLPGLARKRPVAPPTLRSGPAQAGRASERCFAAIALAAVSLLGFLVSGYLELSGGADRIHWRSIRSQWTGQNVLHYQNSIYGNVAVLKSGEQYTFLSDGIPVMTAPVPDITFVEEFAHLTLLSHPRPKHVLVLSGGAGGLLNEILKHPVERVDYAELDPVLLDVVARFPTPLTQNELKDPRVHVSHVDGRLFVKQTTRRYDAVLIGLSNPSDLQVNRLFTWEFYSTLKKKLKQDGIVAVTLPGSLTYLDDNLLRLNACILATLKKVYSRVRIIPGDFNLFLASESDSISRLTSSILARRFSRRNLEARLITKPHIEYRLHPRWLEWFQASLARGKKDEKKNLDFLPRAVFHSLAHWSSIFSPRAVKFFLWSEKIRLWWAGIIAGLFTAGFLLIHFRKRSLSKAAIPLAVAFTGFAGMVYDLVLIFAFQAVYGYVYQWVGILITSFMFGAAAGSLGMVRLIDRIKKNIPVFIGLEYALILFSLILPLTLIFIHSPLNTATGSPLFRGIFLVLCFLSGMITGAQFPLASKIQLKESPRIGHTAGLLYGCDLLGGWFGGIIGGVILLPVLGLPKTCVAVAILKLSSLILVAATRNPRER